MIALGALLFSSALAASTAEPFAAANELRSAVSGAVGFAALGSAGFAVTLSITYPSQPQCCVGGPDVEALAFLMSLGVGSITGIIGAGALTLLSDLWFIDRSAHPETRWLPWTSAALGSVVGLVGGVAITARPQPDRSGNDQSGNSSADLAIILVGGAIGAAAGAAGGAALTDLLSHGEG